MRKIFIASAAALLMTAGAAHAAATMGGLGFHSGAAPIGIRQWFSEQVAGDIGIGWNMEKFEDGSGAGTETLTGINLDFGVPICIKKWDKARFMFRPGFQWGSFKDKTEPTGGTSTEQTFSMIGGSGELEVEYWLADNISVNASHGLRFNSAKDKTTDDKFTSFGTTSNNFTDLGLTVYLW